MASKLTQNSRHLAVRIDPTPEGFEIRIRCADSNAFGLVIDRLKLWIDHRHRRYDSHRRCWRIYRRAEPDLLEWTQWTEIKLGAQIDWAKTPG